MPILTNTFDETQKRPTEGHVLWPRALAVLMAGASPPTREASRGQPTPTNRPTYPAEDAAGALFQAAPKRQWSGSAEGAGRGPMTSSALPTQPQTKSVS